MVSDTLDTSPKSLPLFHRMAQFPDQHWEQSPWMGKRFSVITSDSASCLSRGTMQLGRHSGQWHPAWVSSYVCPSGFFLQILLHLLLHVGTVSESALKATPRVRTTSLLPLFYLLYLYLQASLFPLFYLLSVWLKLCSVVNASVPFCSHNVLGCMSKLSASTPSPLLQWAGTPCAGRFVNQANQSFALCKIHLNQFQEA